MNRERIEQLNARLDKLQELQFDIEREINELSLADFVSKYGIVSGSKFVYTHKGGYLNLIAERVEYGADNEVQSLICRLETGHIFRIRKNNFDSIKA